MTGTFTYKDRTYKWDGNGNDGYTVTDSDGAAVPGKVVRIQTRQNGTRYKAEGYALRCYSIKEAACILVQLAAGEKP